MTSDALCSKKDKVRKGLCLFFFKSNGNCKAKNCLLLFRLKTPAPSSPLPSRNRVAGSGTGAVVSVPVSFRLPPPFRSTFCILTNCCQFFLQGFWIRKDLLCFGNPFLKKSLAYFYANIMPEKQSSAGILHKGRKF